MAKNSKHKLLFITVFLAMLLGSIVNIALVHSAEAAEPTIQQKSLSIANDVLGLNMTKYATTAKEGSEDLYRGVLPQQTVRTFLNSNESKLDILYTFASGKLRQIYVLETKGFPLMTNAVTETIRVGNMTFHKYVFDEVENAKNFLNNYQGYSKKSFYGELASMLSTVDAKKNATITSGNVRFEVAGSANSKTFRWTYTANGIEAPDKCVAFGYKDGFLKYFIDNWDLYKIGSTSVKISEEQAIVTAMERARAFSWKMGSDGNMFAVKGFTVTNAMIWETVYCSNLYADTPRGGDLLTLYPIRHIWVSLDKFYPGNVYGINVYVWADTGEICAINERVSTFDPPANLVATVDDFKVEALTDQALTDSAQSNGLSIAWVAVSGFAAVVLGSVPLWFLLGRKRTMRTRRSFKIGGILLCLLISSMLLLPTSTVNAYTTRRALIWGSRSDGAMTTPPDSYHWRKTADEINRQGITSNATKNYFKDDGYNVNNYQGGNSTKYMILANITDAQTNYPKVAVVDFDHGVGSPFNFSGGVLNEFHYMFEDNNGTYFGPPPMQNPNAPQNGVYDMDIFPETDEEKTFFAFINTCMSANITYPTPATAQGMVKDAQGQPTNRARGMPFAWTHRIVDSVNSGSTINTDVNMSDNGYDDPDDGNFCYIGFPYGSAALDQTITGAYPKYATWVENFFSYALGLDISINHALDEASLDNFGELFGDTDLASGFTAIWPMDKDGDGDWENDYGYGSTLAVYGNGNIHLYEYFVHDYTSATHYGPNSGVNNPDNIEGGSNDGQYTTLYALSWGSQAMIIGSIGWEAKGHIYLYGNTYQGYTSYVQVWVSYDGSYYYSVKNLTITQTSPYWIDIGSWSYEFRYIAIVVYPYGYFAADSVLVIPEPAQTETYYVYDTEDWENNGGAVTNHEYMRGSYHAGDYAILECPNSDSQAYILGTMNKDASGYVEIYGYIESGYPSWVDVWRSNDYQNWYLIDTEYVQSVQPGWISFGTCPSTFKYIAVACYYSASDPAYLYVDCVRVTDS